MLRTRLFVRSWSFFYSLKLNFNGGTFIFGGILKYAKNNFVWRKYFRYQFTANLWDLRIISLKTKSAKCILGGSISPESCLLAIESNAVYYLSSLHNVLLRKRKEHSVSRFFPFLSSSRLS